MKLLILGLDGVYPELLDTFKDILPNLASIGSKGAAATLLSTIPPYTPQAWTTLATGVDPGCHGISGFVRQREAGSGTQELLRRTSIEVPQLWDHLAREKVRTGLLNVPMTFPAPSSCTFAVAGMLTPRVTSAGFTHPDGLSAQLLSQVPGYVIDTAVKKQDTHSPGIVKRLHTMLTERIKAARFLLASHPVDLFFCVFVVLDRVFHLYFRYLDPEDALFETKKAEEIRTALTPLFTELDAFAGETASQADNILICSDHGFRAEEGKFYTNTYLSSLGYAAVKKSPARRAAEGIVSFIGRERLRRFIPRRLFDANVNKTDTLVKQGARAQASPLAAQGIICSDPSIINKLSEQLRALRDPRDGAPLLSALYLREDVYSPPCRDRFPHIVLSLKNGGIEASPHIIGKDALYFTPSSWPGGHHDRAGVCAFLGKEGVETASETPAALPASIDEVMPFVLSLFHVKTSPPSRQRPQSPEMGSRQ